MLHYVDGSAIMNVHLGETNCESLQTPKSDASRKIARQLFFAASDEDIEPPDDRILFTQEEFVLE